MTVHRYVCKLLWKTKIFIPLIFICALIAIATTLYNGNLKKGFLGGGGGERIKPIKPRYDAKYGPKKGQMTEDGAAEVDVSDEAHHAKMHHGMVPNGNVDDETMKKYIVEAKKKAAEAAIQRHQHNDDVMNQHPPIIGENIIRNVMNNISSALQKQKRKSKRPKLAFKSYHETKLSYDPKSPPEIFQYYTNSVETMCSGKFQGYFNEFALLQDVKFDRDYCHGRMGGEEIKDVLLQPEENEFYSYEMGCIQLSCEERPGYFFNNRNHLNDLLFSLQTKDVDISNVRQRLDKGFYILITRYEYANIYHSMTDWYNAFLLMNYFNKTQSETNVIILDGHPKGALDSVWDVLYNSSYRFSDLEDTVLVHTLAFNILGYNSHFLDHSTDTIPLVEPFREFFLNSYRIETSQGALNCDRMSVLFIWRRDYLAHPRNPQGTISRKIANERELIEFLQREYPTFHVKGVQIDLFDMRQQLEYVAHSDVLIGMHGAGLTHGLFLPKHGGMIEMIPNYWSAAMEHFLAIAKWRGLSYERWVNSDPHNEAPEQHTRVPPSVLHVLFRSILRQMGCGPPLPKDVSTTTISNEIL